MDGLSAFFDELPGKPLFLVLQQAIYRDRLYSTDVSSPVSDRRNSKADCPGAWSRVWL